MTESGSGAASQGPNHGRHEIVRVRYAAATEMTYSPDRGFRVKLREESFSKFRTAYEKLGYNVACDDGWCILTCSAETFTKEPPLFIHTYVHKAFHSIPNLFLADPFPGGARYSQLCVTYMLAYILGMLVRYYPTHWMSLIHGDRGDSLWPTLNRATAIRRTLISRTGC